MRTRFFRTVAAVVLAGGFGALTGCTSCPCCRPAAPAVATPPASADAQLATEVQARLERDLATAARTFGVQAHEGIVTVSGSIPNEARRAQVIGIVRGTPGVKGVIDKLFYRP